MQAIFNSVKRFFISMIWAMQQARQAQANAEINRYIASRARTLADVERLQKELDAVGK